jgi:hypothetical protein
MSVRGSGRSLSKKKQSEPGRLLYQFKQNTTQMLANEANDNMIKCMAKRSLQT